MKRILFTNVLVLPVMTGIALTFGDTRLASAQEHDTQRDASRAVAATQNTTDRAHSLDALLAHRVTIKLARVSLKQAIDSISRVSKVAIQYRLPLLTAYTESISLDVADVPLGIALESALDGAHVRVTADGQGNLLLLPALTVSAVDSVVATLAGRVVDSANGRPLAGATIKVAGTKISAIAQDSGHFLLKGVPVGQHVITVRIFGYRAGAQSVDVVAPQTSSVNFRLVLVPTVLSGVVTTATGRQRKLEVGSDITVLNADSIMRVAPVRTVTDLLETRVPGLAVLHSSGAPGDPSRLRLRGAGSVQLNNDPIVIVDGIRVYSNQSDPRTRNQAQSGVLNGSNVPAAHYNAPSPLDQIDPNNIESIEVFKGPSASATYGSDAANGVIVVTTKRGRAGPTQWSLTANTGVSWLPGDWPAHYYRFGVTEQQSNDGIGFGQCTWYDVSCKTDSIVKFQALTDPRYSLFTHGNEQSGSLTISGGTPALTYSVTGGATGTMGYLHLPAIEQQRYDSVYGARFGPLASSLIRPDRYRTWSVGGTVTAQPYRALRVSLQSNLFNSTQQRSSLEIAIPQLQSVYLNPITQTGALFSGEYEHATSDGLTMNSLATAHWEPRTWLPFDVTGGISTVQTNHTTYIPYGISSEISCAPGCGDTTGSYGLGRGASRNQTFQVGTNLPMFNQKIVVAMGGNVYSQSTTDFSVYTNQLAPGVTVPTTFRIQCFGTNQLCDSPTSQSTTSQSTYGWYLEPRLNVASRFFAAPGFRLDGGSGGVGSNLSGFPKMNFSYVTVDRQDGTPLLGLVSLLRTRLSFGFAGTQPSPADKLRIFNAGTYKLTPPGQGALVMVSEGCSSVTIHGASGITTAPGVCVSSLGNTQLHPERSGEIEGGFDLELWRNRFSVTYTKYDKTRHDAILSIPVAPSVYSSGSSVPYNIQQNIGVIKNTGTELTMNATVLESRMVGWTIGVNLSKDNNRVVRLNRGQLPIILNLDLSNVANLVGGVQYRVQAGYPLSGMFAYPITGYADANHNGIIDPSEVRVGDSAVYVGQPNPKYQLDMTQSLSLFSGRLGINATFAYQNGLTQDPSALCSGGLSLLPNDPSATLGTQAILVAASCAAGGVPLKVTDYGFLQTVNTFRFNSLSVNYHLPRSVAQWFRVPQLSAALQGSNLGLRTNYRGIDPNVNAFSTVSHGGDQTADTGQLPQPRTWRLSVTIGSL